MVKSINKKSHLFRGGFLLVAVSELKLESQTCHDVEGRLCVVVRDIAPHVSIGGIRSVAQVSELHKSNQALHIAAIPSVGGTCIDNVIGR